MLVHVASPITEPRPSLMLRLVDKPRRMMTLYQSSAVEIASDHVIDKEMSVLQRSAAEKDHT